MLNGVHWELDKCSATYFNHFGLNTPAFWREANDLWIVSFHDMPNFEVHLLNKYYHFTPFLHVAVITPIHGVQIFLKKQGVQYLRTIL